CGGDGDLAEAGARGVRHAAESSGKMADGQWTAGQNLRPMASQAVRRPRLRRRRRLVEDGRWPMDRRTEPAASRAVASWPRVAAALGSNPDARACGSK